MENNNSKENLKLEGQSTKKKKGPKKNIWWVLGIIVLVLISITFILPAVNPITNRDIVFGSYEGRNISYTDQFFQNQIQIAASSSSQDPSTLMGAYSIYNQAFLATAYYYGLDEIGKDAGVEVTKPWIDRQIVTLGFYNDENGVFSQDIYSSTPEYNRNNIRSIAEGLVRPAIVSTDLAYVKTSDAEISFLQDLSGDVRSFEYIAITASDYPEEEIASYISTHTDSFMVASFSEVTYQDKESAETAREGMLAEGFESFTAANGSTVNERASLYSYTLSSELKNEEDVSLIYSLKKGEISDAVEKSDGSFALYYMNEDAFLADAADEDARTAVRSYISLHDQDTMSTYLSSLADTFISRLASENFYDIARDMNLEITDVAATNANTSQFPLLTSFMSTDPLGYLYTASLMDTEYAKRLFTEEEGSILSPVDAYGVKVITKVGAWGRDSSNSTYIASMYPLFASDASALDTQNAIFANPEFEDNFATVFMSHMLSSSN